MRAVEGAVPDQLPWLVLGDMRGPARVVRYQAFPDVLGVADVGVAGLGLLDKWVKAGAVHAAFDKENPLGQWRERIEAIHGIELPLPPKK